jgi:membrane-associated phospholipid phosphatase
MYMYTTRSEHTKQKIQTPEQTNYPPTAYIVGFIVGLILLVPTAIAAHSHQLSGVQLHIFRAFDNLNLPNSVTSLAKVLTEALGAAYPIAACVLIPLLFKRFRLAWRFFITAGGATAVFYVIKKIIAEPRPIAMLHNNLHQRVVETGPAFPSGHETAATALALTLWMILPAKWRWVAILWIAIIAFTRLYLGVHTPGDVIGGIAIGLMAVSFLNLLPPGITKPLRLEQEKLLEQGW